MKSTLFVLLLAGMIGCADSPEQHWRDTFADDAEANADLWDQCLVEQRRTGRLDGVICRAACSSAYALNREGEHRPSYIHLDSADVQAITICKALCPESGKELQ